MMMVVVVLVPYDNEDDHQRPDHDHADHYQNDGCHAMLVVAVVVVVNLGSLIRPTACDALRRLLSDGTLLTS